MLGSLELHNFRDALKYVHRVLKAAVMLRWDRVVVLAVCAEKNRHWALGQAPTLEAEREGWIGTVKALGRTLRREMQHR